MTKLTVNRLAHALDDLASHTDVDRRQALPVARSLIYRNALMPF